MNTEETGKILAVIKKTYPDAYKNFTDRDKRDLITLWQELFADDDYIIVGAAIKIYIASDTRDKKPTIGKIKEIIRNLTQPEEMSEMSEQEAVNLILRACRNGIYNAEQEFGKLPPVCQRLVGTPDQIKEWAMMDMDELQTVVASNLMRSYRAVASREREHQALPSSVRNMLEGVSERMMLKGGEEE